MLLELKNIEAAYGNIKALKGINLAVPEGKIVTSSSAASDVYKRQPLQGRIHRREEDL